MQRTIPLAKRLRIVKPLPLPIEVNTVINPTKLHVLDHHKLIQDLINEYPYAAYFSKDTKYMLGNPGQKNSIQLTHGILRWKPNTDYKIRYEILGDLIAEDFSLTGRKKVHKSAGAIVQYPDGNYLYEPSNKIIKIGTKEKRMQIAYELGRRLPYLDTQEPITVNFVQGPATFLLENFVEGFELYGLLDTNYPFTTNQCLLIIINLLRAMSYLHACGIVHRDIKPENTIVDLKTFRVYLVDFDLSKELEKEDRDFFAGTPEYISPEVMHHQGTTIKTDLFGVAKVGALLLKAKLANIYSDDQGTYSRDKLLREANYPHFQYLFRSTDLSVQHQQRTRQLFRAMSRPDANERCSPEQALVGFQHLLGERELQIASPQVVVKAPMEHISVTEVGIFLSRQGDRKHNLQRSPSFDSVTQFLRK